MPQRKGEKMNLVEKAGTILIVAQQLNDVMTHAWREWNVDTNEKKDDELARFNHLLAVLQPYSKQINNTFKLMKTSKKKPFLKKESK